MAVSNLKTENNCFGLLLSVRLQLTETRQQRQQRQTRQKRK
jgi:hypothetical protein